MAAPDLISQPDYRTDRKRQLTSNSTILVYPSDYSQHHIEFSFYEVKPSKKGEVQNNGRFTGDTVILPIPNNLADNLSIAYNDIEQGTFFGGIVTDDAVNAAIDKENIKGALGSVSDVATRLVKGGPSLESSLRKAVIETYDKKGIIGTRLKELAKIGGHKLAEVTGGALGARVQSVTGTRFNPFLSVFFQNVNLRNHQFNWKFSPKSEKESELLRDIINFFKIRSLPEKADPRAIRLKNPDQVEVKLWGSRDFLYPFKRCYVEAIDVNYTGEGKAAFFAKTGAPAVLDITISLKEIYVHTSEDYQSFGIQQEDIGVGG